MVSYRYHAIDMNGVPIFGTLEAESEPALRASLNVRGLIVQQCSVLSINATMQQPDYQLPRLYQLRVGEHIREAFLTGLPAHEAVRAMAAEPFRHPLLAMMPLIFGTACVAVLPAMGWQMLLPESRLPTLFTMVFAFVFVPLIWLMMSQWLDVRPRRLLHRLADRLESGNSFAMNLTAGLPTEVQSIMHSAADDRQKALAVSELVPLLMGGRFYTHRLLLTVAGSVTLVLLLGLGFYWAMWQIIPPFASIFEDFDVELPLLTTAVVQFSQMIVWMGTPGFVASVVVSIGILGLLYAGSCSGVVTEWISCTPVLGVPFRWLMQARVARVLGVMLHYDCDRAEALKAAAAASGFTAVRLEGQYIAESIKKGSGIVWRSENFSALPLSLLSMQSRGSNDTSPPATNGIAQNFQAIARMLEQASLGHGRFLGTVLQMLVTFLAGLVVGVVVISMFLPLIRLLNDLS